MEDDLQIALKKLRISMEKRIIKDKNFRTKLANQLKKIGFDVSNNTLEKIWKVLFQTVNRARINWQIDELLQILMKTSEKIFEREDFQQQFENNLKREGIVSGNSKNIWEALFGAVSSVRTVKCINLRSKNINDTEEQLIQMLSSRSTQKQSMKDYLYKPFTRTAASQLKSPEDIAKLGIKEDTPIYFVTNLIKNQFSIHWDTDSENREPAKFNFYTFCDVDAKQKRIIDKKRYLQYHPRRAHVMVQLYRFCRTNTVDNYDKKQLCPPVYIRCNKSWREWVSSGNTRLRPKSHIDWMNQKIYDYIFSHATKIKKSDLKKTLTRPTLYWAVFKDKDFKPGQYLKLNDIGRTQVYVGKAEKGIQERWITNGSSHCRMMKKCLDTVRAMEAYKPLQLKGIQLVDARILLAKLRKEKCALFVMKTYNHDQIKNDLEEDEKDNIDGKQRQQLRGKCRKVKLLRNYPNWKPKNMAYGVNGRR